MRYALFVSNQPYDLDKMLAVISANHSGLWALALPNSTRVMFTGVANGCDSSTYNHVSGHMPY